MNKILNRAKSTLGFGEGHERTNIAKRNISISFLLKGFNILIGILIVPLTLNYLDSTRYGVFITITSLVAWFGFFDVGITHGFRNKFAEAIANNNVELAKKYVSTSYAILGLISACVIILFLFINQFVNYEKVLNVDSEFVGNNELQLIVGLVFSIFFISFVFRMITTILMALQKSGFASLLEFIARFLALISIVILTKTSEGSLLYFALAQVLFTPVILLAYSYYFFINKYNKIAPSFYSVELSLVKDILNLGYKFFIIQIAMVLIYQTNKIIIAQLFDPSYVAKYSVSFAYFSVLSTGFSIIVTPFWSAFTEAWIKKDISWIKSVMNKLLKIWVGLFFVAILMLIFSSQIYFLWIGDKMEIPFDLSLVICLSMLFSSFISIFNHFLNGISRVQIQMYVTIISAILNVPLAIFLGKLIGVPGVVVANVIVLLPSLIIYPIQYNRIMRLSESPLSTRS